MLHIWIWLRPYKIEALRGAGSGELTNDSDGAKEENPAQPVSD